AVVLALCWAAVAFIDGVQWWWALIPTVLTVGVLAGLFVWRRLKAHQAASDIEKSLKAQGDAQLQQVRPDQQADIQAMQAEFAKAIASLKSSKLARGRRDALSILPWYLIIGPPGAGKSTALRKSGLKFPYLSSKGGGVKGVGGTRNCEWWLTNEAVILDTAGRYTTEEDDHEEWFSFLDTLARHRPRRPINGLIVAVSTQDLLSLEGDGATQLGERIRERVNEVTQRLGMVVPIYVLVTKCDLMAGFVETFSHLSKSDRGQIWGFTLPLEAQEEPAGEVVQRNLDELAEVVDELGLRRISEERHPDARERIFGFPLQFDALRAPLVEMIESLFAQNVYTDAPLMRGVYFTSGTQEGKLIDRLIGSMVEAFGIRRQVAAVSVEPGVETKSYFLRDLFSDVIFKDQNLAVRSSAELHRQKLVQYGYAAGGVALALLLLSLPTIAYFQNRAMLGEIRARLPAAPLQGLDALAALSPLGDRVNQLIAGPPMSMRMGMYQGEKVLDPLSRYYGTAVRKILVDPLLEADEDQLEKFTPTQAGAGADAASGEYARFYDKLRLHLLVTGPRSESEPGLSEAEQAWFRAFVANRWARSGRVASDAEFAAALGRHVELLGKLLARDPALLVPRNPRLVREVRTALAGIPPETLALEKILSDPALDRFELSIPQVVGGATSRVRGKTSVRGAFTFKGWNEVTRKRIESADSADAWVMGSERGKAADERFRSALKSRYFAAYIEEWKKFLADVTIAEPKTNAESLAMLEELTRGEPAPLGRVFRSLGINVQLIPGGGKGGFVDAVKKQGRKTVDRMFKGKAGALTDSAEESFRARARSDDVVLEEADLEEAFAGLLRFVVPPERPDSPDAPPPESTALDAYHAELQSLRNALRAAMSNREEGPALEARINIARSQTESSIASQDVLAAPTLRALLLPPIIAVERVWKGDKVEELNREWCSTVVSSFEEKLTKHYPFVKAGHDAPLADVADFFQPEKGTLWSFYKANLARHVVKAGDVFKPVRGQGATAQNLGGQVFPFLGSANEVTNALFSSGAEPLVQFAIHIHPAEKVASVIFTVDGNSIEYRNGPEEWHTFRWPGGDKTLGASLKLRNSGGRHEIIEQEGEWGLFRLLEMGAVQAQPNARVFSVTWKVPTLDTEVTIDFRPQRSDHPFLNSSGKLLGRFRTAQVLPPPLGTSGGCQ
ncbi:MAG TPA: type VI secretion system membrane subunit TssM, partial [Myxococcaceae bacterium]|nr:type VI secretion system membrane subunit TssM [Myxococcaceae bacterium]